MAFIPDEAIEDCNQISFSAFRLYCWLCKRRNHEKKTAFASVCRLQAILGISRSNAYQTLRELNQTHWIASNGPEHELLKGDFTPVNRVQPPSRNLDNVSNNLDKYSRNSGQDNMSSILKPRSIEPELNLTNAAIGETPTMVPKKEICPECRSNGFLNAPSKLEPNQQWLFCKCVAGKALQQMQTSRIQSTAEA